MSRYNHFADCPYQRIVFKDLAIGEQFRRAKHKGSRCTYILCIKTGRLAYMDKISKEEHNLFSEEFNVYITNKNS